MEAIKIVRTHPDAKMPHRHYYDDACYDLYAVEDVTITGDEVKKVKFGIVWEMPEGYEAVIRPRSSSFTKKNLHIQIGTIDTQYRGEIMCVVSLINPHPARIGELVHTINKYTIKKGESIAQVAFRHTPKIIIMEVGELKVTGRGTGGFGSTDEDSFDEGYICKNVECRSCRS